MFHLPSTQRFFLGSTYGELATLFFHHRKGSPRPLCCNNSNNNAYHTRKWHAQVRLTGRLYWWACNDLHRHHRTDTSLQIKIIMQWWHNGNFEGVLHVKNYKQRKTREFVTKSSNEAELSMMLLPALGGLNYARKTWWPFHDTTSFCAKWIL